MPNLYEYIGIRADATQEEIARAIELANIRWMQTGEINKRHIQEALRDAKEILMDPARRSEYDKDQKITETFKNNNSGKSIGLKSNSPHLLTRLSAGQKAAILVILGIALLISLSRVFFLAPVKDYPVGCYLLAKSGGKVVAILSNVAADHRFEDGRVTKGYEVLTIDTGQRTWMDIKKIRSDYSEGKHAPYSEWAAPKAVAQPAATPSQVAQPAETQENGKGPTDGPAAN